MWRCSAARRWTNWGWRQRPVKQLDGMVVVVEQPGPDVAAERERQRVEAVERQRQPAQPLRLLLIGDRIRRLALIEPLAVAGRGQRARPRITRIERPCPVA